MMQILYDVEVLAMSSWLPPIQCPHIRAWSQRQKIYTMEISKRYKSRLDFLSCGFLDLSDGEITCRLRRLNLKVCHAYSHYVVKNTHTHTQPKNGGITLSVFKTLIQFSKKVSHSIDEYMKHNIMDSIAHFHPTWKDQSTHFVINYNHKLARDTSSW